MAAVQLTPSVFQAVRYRAYSRLLRSKMAQYPQLDTGLLQTTPIGELDEEAAATLAPLPATAGTTASEDANREQQQRRSGGRSTERYSYLQAVAGERAATSID